MQEPVATTSNDEEDDRVDALEQAARLAPQQIGQLDLSLSLQQDLHPAHHWSHASTAVHVCSRAQYSLPASILADKTHMLLHFIWS